MSDIENTVEAPVAADVEVKAEAVEVETKSDPIADIEAKVDAVAAESVEVKAANAALEAKTAELTAELEAKNADIEAKAAALEEFEAKAAAPMINTKSTKESNTMDNQVQFKTFLAEGVDGLRAKGADLQISVDSQGGYALPEELRQEIIKIEHEASPMRQVASVVSAGTTDVKQLVSVGNAASGWVGETDSRAKTNSPDLAQRTAVFGEVYAKPLVYQHMLEDAFFGVEAWLTGEIGRQFAEAEGSAFLNGDGSNKPVGILNGLVGGVAAPSSDTSGTFEVHTSAASGALGADAEATINYLRSIVESTRTGYLPGAKWMMNRATHGALSALANANGEYFLQRNITEAAASKLFGFDIIINEDMDDIGATNIPVMFGDFARGFQIVDRVGVSMLRDPYTQPGAVSFYTRKRVGSMILDARAVKAVSCLA